MWTIPLSKTVVTFYTNAIVMFFAIYNVASATESILWLEAPVLVNWRGGGVKPWKEKGHLIKGNRTIADLSYG